MDQKQLKELVGRYRRVFKGGASAEDCKIVLEDIRKRSFVDTTTLDSCPAKMGFNEGRRSLWVRIETMLNKNPEELQDLPRTYDRKPKTLKDLPRKY